MADEVDPEAFVRAARFCAYVHSRPDGRPFYVGKGLRRRAFDFAPSRRTAHHRNIVAKYGAANIRVLVVPAASEVEALELEKALIASYRAAGAELANLTDGGEGSSGHVANEAQRRALAKGRGPGRVLSSEAVANIAAGLARGREKAKAWHGSPAGREHLRKLGEGGRVRLHAERGAICDWCGERFITRSAKAHCCSRLCEQRRRRHRIKWGM